MPTKGNPRHAFRFEPDLWDLFLSAIPRDPRGRDASGVVRDLVAWYAGHKGAPKPERPGRERADAAPAEGE
jgi:hypothetical protein